MIVRYERGSKWAAYGENLMDVAAYLRTSERHWRSDISQSRMRSPSWDLDVGYNGATRLAHDGWSDGARELHGLIHAADIKNERHTVEQWDIAGHAPDVARYLAGDPAHMRRRSRSPDTTRAPIVSLIYNIVAAEMVSAKSLALMGSAMVAIVDQLETRGRRVELSVGYSARLRGGKNTIAGWLVKRAEDQLDIAAVAFSVAHPAAMRRLCLGIVERSPYEWTDDTYGRPMALQPGDLPGADDNALIVQGLSIHSFTAPTSVLGAVNLLAKQINEAHGSDLIEVAVQV